MNYMKLLAVVTPPSIYHGCSTRTIFGEKKFTPMTIKMVVVAMLGNMERSRTASSPLPWTYI